MKKVFLLCMTFCTTLTIGSNTSLYDAINGKELIFAATSRYEKLIIEDLNPTEEVGYRFFTFQNEEYEKLRIREIHDKFKKRPLESSFKQVADSLGRMHFQNNISEQSYHYRNREYPGYVVEYINLYPISYLDNTLTFSFSAELQMNGTAQISFNVEEIYYLNLDDFSIMPAQAIHEFIDHSALRKAMVKKWRGIQDEMPNKNWNPLQEKIKDRENDYEEDYGYEDEEMVEPKTFYSDSLISYGVQNADLTRTQIIYTGAGVLVVLKNAVPWFSSEYEAPLQIQLHLDAHEAKAALRNFEPFGGLQNAEKQSPGNLPVDPHDFFTEASFLRLSHHHINYLRLDDTEITAIEKYVKNNPTDSQYIHKIIYKDGRAERIEGDTRHDISVYDSINWKEGKVHAAISQRAENNYNTGRYEPVRYLQLQARDEFGNSKWYLNTERGFNMLHYSYFKGKVARYRYSILRLQNDENEYNQKPYWFEFEKMGLCDDNGLCAKVDEMGRPVVEFRNYFAYKDGKLVQILGDREYSTLFYYDDKNRLSEIIKIENARSLYKYFYESGEILPYRIESLQPNQNRPQNTYLILHK